MANERLPLFPLPNVVFFPGTFLNLHVFEDRYVQMMRDILDGSGRIAITLANEVGPKPTLDAVALGEVRPVVTVGSIRRYEPLPDDRYDLVLFGESRARIVAQRFEKPYREAVVEPIPEDAGGDPHALEVARTELMARYELLLEDVGEGGARDKLDTAGVTLETLVNAVPSLLNLPAGERQRLLEIDSLLERCVETSRHLDDVLSRKNPPDPT